MPDPRFSEASVTLPDSATHGTKAKIAELNARARPDAQVIDLSIGTLDLLADRRIDAASASSSSRMPG